MFIHHAMNVIRLNYHLPDFYKILCTNEKPTHIRNCQTNKQKTARAERKEREKECERAKERERERKSERARATKGFPALNETFDSFQTIKLQYAMLATGRMY